MIDLGKIIARVITVNDVLELNNSGFSQELTDNCIQMVRQEIMNLLASIQNHENISALEETNHKSDWMAFS